MHSNKTELAAMDSSESPSVYFCPVKPIYTWILTETAAFYSSIIIKTIASPITVLLNILVIVAVKKRRALQTNSNILLASMAVADLLVGAVSMPLTTSLDVLLLRKDLSLTICKIAFANQIVLYSAVTSSFYHLTAIALDRYIAIKKWRSYKIVVTRARVKKCAVVVWLFAVITVILVPVLRVAGVKQLVFNLLSLFSASKTVACLAFIGYCYITAYLSVRNRKGNESISDLATRHKARLENTVAKATGLVTAALLISYIPSIIVLYLGGAVPFLRTSSYFRWSELLIQMNSLMNPIIYCFAMNRSFRNEVLEMIKIKKPDPVVHRASPAIISANQRRTRRFGAHEALEGGQEFDEGEKHQQPDVINGAMSCDSLELADPCHMSSNVNNQSLSTGEEIRVIRVDVHQPNSNRKPQPIQATDVPTEENQSLSEKRRDENVPKCITESMMERPVPTVSLYEDDQIIGVNVHEPKATTPTESQSQNKGRRDQSLFNDN